MPMSQADATDMLNVSERSVRAAVTVRDHGASLLIEAVERSEISVSAATDVARMRARKGKFSGCTARAGMAYWDDGTDYGRAIR